MASKKKSETYIIIPGDPISRKEVIRTMNQEKLRYLDFEMEKIRVSSMTANQKEIARSHIAWQIAALKEQMLERS